MALDSSSEDSVARTQLDPSLEVNIGPALGVHAREIFVAAQHFSQKDRDEALFERRKNSHLMDFLSAHGISSSDVQAYLSEGKIQNLGHARQVIAPISSSPLSGSAVNLSILGKGSDAFISNLRPISHAEEGEISPPASVEVPKSWSAVVTKNLGKASRSLSFHPPVMENGDILVKPPDDMLARGNLIWSTSLVGYFLHSNLPFKVVEPIAKRLWGNLGLTKVFMHNKGYYIFKFKSSTDRDNILASGPWHFASKVIVLQKWQEGVEFTKSDCDKIPIWVKLSQIPLSYWSDEGISYIASALGKPLFTDEMTTNNDFLNFARVCIEVSATSSFPSSIKVVVMHSEKSEKTFVPVDVEYQSRPPVCPFCKVFGHSQVKCPKANFKWVPKSTPAPPSGATDTVMVSHTKLVVPSPKVTSFSIGNENPPLMSG